MLPTTSAIWSSLMLLLGLPISTASPIAGQGDPTALQCGRREPGGKWLATCRADANFNPNSMPARMAYGWALIEAQRYGSFGPAIVAGLWQAHWIYWFAPITGMMVAARVYEFLRQAEPPAISLERPPLGVQGPIPEELRG